MKHISSTTISRYLNHAPTCLKSTLGSSSKDRPLKNLGAYDLECYQVHSIILSSEIYSTTSAPPLCFETPASFVLKLNCTPNTVIALTFYYYAK